jgi:hypothetical protein
VATYYDKREGREKTIPNCEKHGLVWNPETQRCEKPMFSGLLTLGLIGFLIWFFRK